MNEDKKGTYQTVAGAIALVILVGFAVVVERGSLAATPVPPNCTRYNPATGVQDCIPRLMAQCPAGWVPIASCPPSGTVEIPPVEVTPVPPTPVRTAAGTPTRTPTSPAGGTTIVTASLPLGYHLEVDCAAQGCSIDYSTQTWKIHGPGVLRVVKE
jgi:hypothetical protein